MVSRSAGLYFVVASIAFWSCWALMPGLGVTDTAMIFALVRGHRPNVHASVVLQLVSAAAYVPGLTAILVSNRARESGAVYAGCVLLATGAMGSAADAIFHLVAYEMTAPGIAAEAVAPVMRQLQGPDLALLLPFVAAFFVGHALLVVGLRTRGPVARFGVPILLAAPLIALVGAPIARSGILPGRFIGLGALGAMNASMIAVGVSMLVD